MKVTHRVVIGTLLSVSAAFVVSSIVTKHWIHWEVGPVEHHRGLWQQCQTQDDIKCTKLPAQEKTDYLRGTQTLMICSAVCMLGGVIYLGVATFLQKLHPFIVAVIALTGDITLVVAVSLYTATIDIPKQSWKYGFSYALAWASVLPAAVVICVVIIMTLLKGRKEQSTQGV